MRSKKPNKTKLVFPYFLAWTWNFYTFSRKQDLVYFISFSSNQTEITHKKRTVFFFEKATIRFHDWHNGGWTLLLIDPSMQVY